LCAKDALETKTNHRERVFCVIKRLSTEEKAEKPFRVRHYCRLPASIARAIKETWALIRGSEARTSEGRLLTLFATVALVLRLPFLVWTEPVYYDSTVYIAAARDILQGEWTTTIYPPLYPLLITIVNFITGDYAIAGILISMVFGILLVVPVFYLAKEMYGVRTGAIAAMLAAAQPCLLRYSGSVLTESIYYFIVAVIGLFAVKTYFTGRFRWAVALGSITAAGYLAREETVGFLIVICVWILFVRPSVQARPLIRRVLLVTTAAVCFVAFSSPYLILLKKDTGRWELSKKVSVSVSEKGKEGAKLVLPNEVVKKRFITFESAVRMPLVFARASFFGVFRCFYEFQHVLNPFLFFLVVWGFLRKKDGDYPRKQNALILSFILFFFALVFPFFKTDERYVSHLIPLALPWGAFGFLALVELIDSRNPKSWMAVGATGLCVMLMMTGLFVQGITSRHRAHRWVQRDVGLWLKQHGSQNEKLMSRSITEAFYSNMELVPQPESSFEDIVEAARRRSVQYLVIDDTTAERVPDFLERAKREKFVLLKYWARGIRKVWLFRRNQESGAQIEKDITST
jgi:4-amino-4-deoxy-L-arabinose transferase-like glycosyltransferase